MESDSINFAQVWAVLRRRALLVIFCMVVVAGAAFAFTKSKPTEYTATSSLVFADNSLGTQITGLTPIATGSQVAEQASNVELVELGGMAATTAQRLGKGLTATEVSDSVEALGQGESNIVGVAATSTSPRLAAKIATTYAHAFVEQRRGENEQFFETALRLVEEEIERFPAGQEFGPAAIALQNRAQNLRLLRGLDFSDVRVAQKATVPKSPSAPDTAKATVVGAMLGLLLGLGLAFLLERLDRDRRIREPVDLEEIYRLPVLGPVPESVALAKIGGPNGRDPNGLPPLEAEAFNLIRAHLRFASEDRTVPRTIMVAAAARGDGATTVARCLAETTARMGSRVLLVEADFRAPSLALRLGLPQGPGLPEVLAGTASMHEAIRSVGFGSPAPDGRVRALDVLACGPVALDNPTELIEGEGMEVTLGYARSAYDLVVVDAPPLTEVSDAFSLLSRVDGVVVVSWVGRSRRDAAARLHRALVSSGAPQLGVIANRVRSRNLSAYSAAPSLNSSVPAGTSSNGLSRHPAPAPPSGS